jgi:site-specific DNA-methyltransferase (adenine-specific)
MRYEINAKNKGDGLALLQGLTSDSLPVVFFDPQYRTILNKLAYGNEGARQKGRASLPQMADGTIEDFLTEITRAVRPSGHLFLWVDKLILCEGTFRWREMPIVDLITWRKPKMGMGYRSRRVSEYLLVMQKPPTRAKGVWRDHGIPDVWPEEPAPGLHPHRKPLQLQERLIRAVTEEGELVVDPAAGSFSVLAAASAANREFLGCDIRGAI